MQRTSLVWSGLAFAVLAPLACRSEPASEAVAPSQAATAEPPPPVRFGPEHTNALLFTFRDPESGKFTSVDALDAVPDEARKQVVVVDLDASPEARGAQRFVHVADLRKVRADGTYPVSIASRYAFEGGGPSDRSSGAVGPSDQVIVYSASWCGVCRKTKRILKGWGVPFHEKDIEASRSAAQELQSKCAQAGLRPGGVPVIDVKGQLFQGLDETRLRDALVAAGLLESS